MAFPLIPILIGGAAFIGSQVDDAVEEFFRPPQGGIVENLFSTSSLIKIGLAAGAAYGGYKILKKIK